MAFDPREFFRSSKASGASAAPLAGTRAERVQRLQIGLFGLGMMVLLVGLANIIMDSAQETRKTIAAEAAPETPPDAASTPVSDPLADAGVVPDLPADPDSGDGGADGQKMLDPSQDLPPPQPQD